MDNNMRCLCELLLLRKNTNWEIEGERRKLLRQLYPLTFIWQGQLPQLAAIFRPEEIDWLISHDLFNGKDSGVTPLIDFVICTGYKDKPSLDKDGKPLLQRTTPVHRMARCYRLSTSLNMEKLFKIYARFDVDYTDELGVTHFHVACQFGHVEAVKNFLELKQDPNCRVLETGDSPMSLSIPNGFEQVAELLLKNGADPDLANNKGLTILHIFCREPRGALLSVRFFEIMDELQKPLQIDAQNELGETPLHLALYYLDFDMAYLLLIKGADLNLASKDGSTPLHVFCRRAREDNLIMKQFMIFIKEHKQVQVNARDNSGRTPLQWAVANLLSNTVSMLLEKVADVSGFVFPTEDYFAKRYTLNCSLQTIVFQTMIIVHYLETKEYKMDQTAALTIMKTFAKHGLFDESMDICECLRSDEDFARIAKRQLVTVDMSLYDFLQLPPEEAEKVFDIRNYDEFTSKISHIRDESHRAYNKYLCETATRGFIRRWALKSFSEKNLWLSTRYCNMFIGQLKIKGLWELCMEAAGQDTKWLAYVRTDYIKEYYNRQEDNRLYSLLRMKTL